MGCSAIKEEEEKEEEEEETSKSRTLLSRDFILKMGVRSLNGYFSLVNFLHIISFSYIESEIALKKQARRLILYKYGIHSIYIRHLTISEIRNVIYSTISAPTNSNEGNCSFGLLLIHVRRRSPVYL
jgi:hypothetical protein